MLGCAILIVVVLLSCINMNRSVSSSYYNIFQVAHSETNHCNGFECFIVTQSSSNLCRVARLYFLQESLVHRRMLCSGVNLIEYN